MRFFVLLILILAYPSFIFAEDFPQEIHISSKGEAHLVGGEVASKYALNLFTVKVWGQKWMIATDYVTKFESASSTKIEPEEILTGHRLEIKGRPIMNKVGYIEAVLVRDLSLSDNKGQSVSDKTVKILTKYLKLGMKGQEVVLLQEFLQKNKWGIPSDGPVTGYFGNVTKDAVVKFQQANGFEAIGEVGPKTRVLINSLLRK